VGRKNTHKIQKDFKKTAPQELLSYTDLILTRSYM